MRVVRRWASDPRAFVLEAIRPPKTERCPTGISQQQAEALEAVRKVVRAKLRLSSRLPLSPEEFDFARKDGISVQAGRGTGKDTLAAWLILWFLFCYKRCKIPCTAPTKRQLHDVLWAEIAKWIRHSVEQHAKDGSPFRLDQWITWQSERVFFTEAKGSEWFAIAITTNVKTTPEEQAETLSGLHEDYMMIVADEASGIPDPVFRPLEGTMTGILNFLVLIFNPTQSKGFAIESQQKNRAHFVCLQWSSEDSELVTREQIEKMEKKYGRDSDPYRISVLGLPPKADPDTLIPWDWILSCVDLDLEPDEHDQYVISVDVGGAGDGDPTILMVHHGPRLLDIYEFRSLDTYQIANWVQGIAYDVEPACILIDAIGIGTGVANDLRHQTYLNVIDVNVSEVYSLSEPDRFHKRRDELWWRLRERFEKRNISIPNDDELIGELSTPKWAPLNGKVKVEGKKELRSRGIASPNKADALMLAQHYTRDTYRRMRQPTPGRRRMAGGRDTWRTV